MQSFQLLKISKKKGENHNIKGKGPHNCDTSPLIATEEEEEEELRENFIKSN